MKELNLIVINKIDFYSVLMFKIFDKTRNMRNIWHNL